MGGTIGRISEIAAAVAAAVETGTASDQVLSSARSLSKESGELRLEVDKFLRTVRTGPADRRLHDDPNYAGPERRADHPGLPATAVPPRPDTAAA